VSLHCSDAIRCKRKRRRANAGRSEILAKSSNGALRRRPDMQSLRHRRSIETMKMPSLLRDAVQAYTERRPGTDTFWSTPLDPLMLMRAEGPTAPRHALYRPALCLNVQGAKQVMLGEAIHDYGEGQFLVVSLDLPLLGRVTQAAPCLPFLGMALEFDVNVLRDIGDQLELEPATEEASSVFVADLDPPLADCLLRLVRLLETPPAIPILYPAIQRELYYHLLTGPHGRAIRRIALPDCHTRRIGRAIRLLHERFASAIRIEALAEVAAMSPSSFHQHFKSATTMTPLQYQKQLRLLEARRLMVAEAANAMSAAYRVGYESASQFSRDYARMFGTPPRRDTVGLRAQAV
jgi:AraC-like DNA-binding protein